MSESEGNQMHRLRTKDLVQIALMTSMLSAFSIIAIPLGPVPITLQTFFFILIPALLGSKKGAASIGLYLLIGLVGLPVFAGGSGGLQSLFSPSFGYVLGALVATPLIGKAAENDYRFRPMLGISLLGLCVIYTVGIAYSYWVMNGVLQTSIGWSALFLMNLTTFLPLDFIKILAVGIVYTRLPVKYKQNIKTNMTQIEKK